MQSLGSQIKTSRKLAGLTQEQLAEKANMTRQQIQRIENDKHSPLYCNLIKIKQALGI